MSSRKVSLLTVVLLLTAVGLMLYAGKNHPKILDIFLEPREVPFSFEMADRPKWMKAEDGRGKVWEGATVEDRSQLLHKHGNTEGLVVSEGRVCVSGMKSQTLYVPCKAEQLGPRVLPADSSIIETDIMPPLLHLFPEVGNGHLATVVQSKSLFMNGLYNGANVSSTRARIPTAAILVSFESPTHGVTGKFRLDMGRGVFSELYTGDGFSVEVRRYAHRELTRLLVTEVVVNRTSFIHPITLTFDFDTGSPSEDIDFFAQNPGLWMGRTKEAEYPQIANTTPVTVMYTVGIPNITFAPSAQGTVAFFTSVSVDYVDAYTHYREGMSRLSEGTLFSSHIKEWEALWERGRIDMTGNLTMALNTNAALYYLLSALPLKADTSWPFVGISPGGLAHGSHADYNGHVFWDQDTWMFPPLALLHADLGRLIVGTRLRTHSAAQLYAKMSGLKGARYPWESAFTGLNTSPSEATTEYELHVTGDTSWMMRQYLQLTNDTQFLTHDGGYQVIADIADFWLSRSEYDPVKHLYEIKGVMGPDEYHSPVNNSVYTNVIAVQSLRTALYAASLARRTPDPQWDKVASNMYLPFDVSYGYYPEYDNYTKGTVVKQADVILLGFPLEWNMTGDVHWNDLTYYASVTPGGPAMTWGIFAINWLRLDQEDRAQTAFNKGTLNIQEPFKVWSENADGSGAYNFHTGMGGYLQSLLYGYLGVDLNDEHLNLNPRLPPSLTTMAIRGVDYQGSTLDVSFDADHMNISLTKAGPPLMLNLKKEQKTVNLFIGSMVTVVRQPASILPRSP